MLHRYLCRKSNIKTISSASCNLIRAVSPFLSFRFPINGTDLLSRNFILSSKNTTTSDKDQQKLQNIGIMKGILVENFGSPEELKVKYDLPLPLTDLEKPQPKQVLVRVLCAGVNPVDTYIRSGQYARLPNLPYIPGNDCAGYIEAIGCEVCADKFPLGSRVFVTGAGKNSGSYAEFVASDENFVFPLDERLSFSQGASLGVPYFTAYKALILGAKTQKGENVLIHGASGAVGSAAIQIANSVGATVYGTAGTKDGMDIVSKCGAHYVFNHHEKDYEVKLKEKTNGQGFNVVIENLANVNLEKDMQMLQNGARIMVVGSRGTITVTPRHLMVTEASIQGVALAATTDEQYKQIGIRK